jgi:hypothetical protein
MKYIVDVKVKVKDSRNNVINTYKHRCNTFVKNFLMLLNAGYKVSTSSVVDTGGTIRSASAKYCVSWYRSWGNNWYDIGGSGPGGWAASAAEGDATFGIIVGTGTTPVSVTDYKLASKIAHGNGAGQLYHKITILFDPTVDGDTVIQKVSRTFTNNSGADIAVNEIGLVLKTNCDNFLIMVIRDVIIPLNIPSGGEAIIDILLKTTA